MITLLKGLTQIDFSSKDVTVGTGAPTATPETYEPHVYIDSSVNPAVIYLWSDLTDTWSALNAGGSPHNPVTVSDNNIDLVGQDLAINIPNLTANLNLDDLVSLTGLPSGSVVLNNVGPILTPAIANAINEIETYLGSINTTLNNGNGTTWNGINTSVDLGGTISLATSLDLNGGSLTIQDSNVTPVGIEYSADYGVTYTDRSITDWGNVKSRIATIIGIPTTDLDLGTFTGTIISDNTDVKTALQELENYVGITLLGDEGITRNGNFFELGGTVDSKNILIDIVGDFSFKIEKTNYFSTEWFYDNSGTLLLSQWLNQVKSGSSQANLELYADDGPDGDSLVLLNSTLNTTTAQLALDTKFSNGGLGEATLGISNNTDSTLITMSPILGNLTSTSQNKLSWDSDSVTLNTYYEVDNDGITPTASADQFKVYAFNFNSIVGRTSPYMLTEDNKNLSVRRSWHRDYLVEFIPSIDTVQHIDLPISSSMLIQEFVFDTNMIDSLTVAFRKSSAGSAGAFSITYPISSPLNTAEIDNLNNAIIAAAGSGFVTLEITATFDVAWTTRANVIVVTEPANNR
jgi:hypothetical protein